MFLNKVFSRVSRPICRSSTLLSASQRSHHSYSFSNHFHSLVSPSPIKLIPVQVNLLPPLKSSSSTPRIGFSSSASPETTEKEKGNNVHNRESTNDDQAKNK